MRFPLPTHPSTRGWDTAPRARQAGRLEGACLFLKGAHRGPSSASASRVRRATGRCCSDQTRPCTCLAPLCSTYNAGVKKGVTSRLRQTASSATERGNDCHEASRSAGPGVPPRILPEGKPESTGPARPALSRTGSQRAVMENTAGTQLEVLAFDPCPTVMDYATLEIRCFV